MLKRLIPPALALALSFGAAAAPLQADPLFSAAQKEAIGKIVRDYLLKNPEVLAEAMAELTRRREAAEQAAVRKALEESRDALLRNPADPVGGNPAGSVTVVEFFDYNCGWCKRAYPHMRAAVKADGDVRIVYKEFPILAPSSRFAAKAALAARRQGRYGALHDLLMTHRGALDEARIVALAERAGLDLRRLKADMAAPEIAAAIEANMALAKRLGIQGTPAFAIGGRVIPGMLREAELIGEIRRARKECAAAKAAVC